MHITLLFPYDDEAFATYFAVLEIEFTVSENRIEIIDTEVAEVVGQSEEFRARVAKDVLRQFVLEDYTDHFMQAAFEWENPLPKRLPKAFEYLEGQDYDDPYMDDDLTALKDYYYEEGQEYE